MINELAFFLGTPAGGLILCTTGTLLLALAARFSAASGKGDRLDSLMAAFFFIELSSAFILLSFGFDGAEEAESDPALVPLLWGVSLLICSVTQFIRIWNKKDYKPIRYGHFGRVAAVIAVVAVTIALFNTLGFFLSTGAMIAALMFLMGERRIVLVCAAVSLWIFVTWAVFNKLLLLGLPTGSLFQ
ncbi:MAG: tripartite tricarboxylate transporter TctB family protein [Synergistaceae bacterium]|nr:tripartite tricarboxylate transporter TctB family protein [Synergistaceae bacterium]